MRMHAGLAAFVLTTRRAVVLGFVLCHRMHAESLPQKKQQQKCT
ncbi:hypothetical protein CKAH01_12056 [Colletotrichum kahawae]|uniref:Uncharacterized protein n=1 Tax=Colletotrichum kahawae TaxID=34407 RepID=A0AAD9YUI9_COLKA|nr:hypothetical protein CKAH01_12056 [Colletotrichum kahawae]